LIEGRYLSHLKKLEQQLESKLDETKDEEENFRTAIQELEKEIYDLVSNSEKLESPNGNNKHNQ
jgi:HPt (histidine-containing phosphotransfer) domain-containing protein